MTTSSPPPSRDENYHRRINLNKQKAASPAKDPNLAVMDGSDDEGEEGDDDDSDGDDDPPPTPRQAAIPEEACFPMILSTESTNPRKERSISSTNTISPMMYDSAQSTKCRDQLSSTSCQFITLKVNINLQETNPFEGFSFTQPTFGPPGCKTTHDLMHPTLRSGGCRKAANLMHPTLRSGGCRKLIEHPSQGCPSPTSGRIKSFKEYRMFCQVKSYVTTPAPPTFRAGRTASLMHPKCSGGCGKLLMHPSQDCAFSTSYQIRNNKLHQLEMQDQESTVNTFRKRNQHNEARPTAAQRHNNRSIYNTKTGTQDFQ